MTLFMRALPLGFILLVFSMSIPTGMYLTSLNIDSLDDVLGVPNKNGTADEFGELGSQNRFVCDLFCMPPQIFDAESCNCNDPEPIPLSFEEQFRSYILSPMFIGLGLISVSIASFLYWKRR